MKAQDQIICDDCGKQIQPLSRAHNCDGGEALRKAAHELFAPTVPLIESVLAKAGTGILRGVFEVVAERDSLRNSNRELCEIVHGAMALIEGPTLLTEANADDWLRRARSVVVR